MVYIDFPDVKYACCALDKHDVYLYFPFHDVSSLSFQLIGLDRPCFVSEHSSVDPHQKTMTLKSRNVS